MRQLTFLLSIGGITINFFGCRQDIQSNCRSVTESIYINDRFPSHIEQYHPDSLRVFTFESDFKDSVTVSVGGSVAAKGYLVTKSNGFAGRLLIKAQANEELRINSATGCAHFHLKEGYKYLYINRSENKKWDVVYSNFGRGYL
jgi:hypothetical protein